MKQMSKFNWIHNNEIDNKYNIEDDNNNDDNDNINNDLLVQHVLALNWVLFRNYSY